MGTFFYMNFILFYFIFPCALFSLFFSIYTKFIALLILVIKSIIYYWLGSWYIYTHIFVVVVFSNLPFPMEDVEANEQESGNIYVTLL